MKIPECIKEVFRRWNIRYAILFGSYAEGVTTPMSDVDIAVKAGRRLSFSEIGLMISELEECLNKTVDLVILDIAPPAITWEALVKGTPIYFRGSKERREYFWDKSEIIDKIADLEPLLKLIYGEARLAISRIASKSS